MPPSEKEASPSFLTQLYQKSFLAQTQEAPEIPEFLQEIHGLNLNTLDTIKAKFYGENSLFNFFFRYKDFTNNLATHPNLSDLYVKDESGNVLNPENPKFKTFTYVKKYQEYQPKWYQFADSNKKFTHYEIVEIDENDPENSFFNQKFQKYYRLGKLYYPEYPGRVVNFLSTDLLVFSFLMAYVGLAPTKFRLLNNSTKKLASRNHDMKDIQQSMKDQYSKKK